METIKTYYSMMNKIHHKLKTFRSNSHQFGSYMSSKKCHYRASRTKGIY